MTRIDAIRSDAFVRLREIEKEYFKALEAAQKARNDYILATRRKDQLNDEICRINETLSALNKKQET